MAIQQIHQSSQEFGPTTKAAKASLLDSPYLLGVALVSPTSLPLFSHILNVNRRK
jgi:hypothetical protein